MNWKAWLGYGIYKKLWSILGKRPWTLISRDIWHLYEYFPLMGCLIIGFLSGYFWHEILSWCVQHPLLTALLIIPLGCTIWFALGHILWGKDWIPHQQPKEKEDVVLFPEED